MFAVITLIFGSLGFVGSNAASAEQLFTDDEPVAGNLTQTFLTVSDLVADEPVVHLDDTILYLEILNTGGSTGDDNYTSCISQARVDTVELLNSTAIQSAKVMLGKAI